MRGNDAIFAFASKHVIQARDFCVGAARRADMMVIALGAIFSSFRNIGSAR